MNEMVERGAIAACNSFYRADWNTMSAFRKQICYGIAIAVIEAMREPTEIMVAAADEHALSPDFRDEWRAAIDAALQAPALPSHKDTSHE